MADPTGPDGVDALDAVDVSGGVLDGGDDGGVDGVHEPVKDLASGADKHGEDRDGDAERDDWVGAFEPGPGAERADDDGEGGESVGAGVMPVGLERGRADAPPDPDAVEGDELVPGEPDDAGGEQPADVVEWPRVDEPVDRLPRCVTADRAIIAITNTPARSSARR